MNCRLFLCMTTKCRFALRNVKLCIRDTSKQGPLVIADGNSAECNVWGHAIKFKTLSLYCTIPLPSASPPPPPSTGCSEEGAKLRIRLWSSNHRSIISLSWGLESDVWIKCNLHWFKRLNDTYNIICITIIIYWAYKVLTRIDFASIIYKIV